VNDLAIAALLMGFLIALAIAAPIWGYDSRDGVDSDQAARRVAWLHPYDAGSPDRDVAQSARFRVAGTLRAVAHILDADAATDERVNGTAVAAH